MSEFRRAVVATPQLREPWNIEDRTITIHIPEVRRRSAKCFLVDKISALPKLFKFVKLHETFMRATGTERDHVALTFTVSKLQSSLPWCETFTRSDRSRTKESNHETRAANEDPIRGPFLSLSVPDMMAESETPISFKDLPSFPAT